MDQSNVHTVWYKDKSFLMAVATILSIGTANLLHINISADTLLTVFGLVATFTAASKTKQAIVASAEAAAKAAANQVQAFPDAAKSISTELSK